MPRGRRIRVLAIDDHRPSLIVLRHALTTRGYICETAETVDVAIAGVAAFKPHLVVYEWNLRGGGGLGLARRLRRAARSRLKIVAISTLDEPEDFSIKENVDAYLTKPFETAALDAVLVSPSGRRRR